jgi:hypothetical protein
VRKFKRFAGICLILLISSGLLFSQSERRVVEITPAGKGKVNTKIDNIGYWSRMVKLGYVTPNPIVEIPKGKFTGTKITEYINPLDTGPNSFFSRHDSSIIGHWSLVNGHWSLVIGHW